MLGDAFGAGYHMCLRFYIKGLGEPHPSPACSSRSNETGLEIPTLTSHSS